MFLSLFICQITYFLICSSFRPTVLTQYPFAQKCRPQYRFFNSKCRSNNLIALFPFRNPITSATEYFGGNEITKWICSIWTFPASISICFHSHSCRMIALRDFPYAPFSILNRYFGHPTTWNLHSQTVCANFCKRLICCLLSMLRVTHHILRRLFLFCNHYATRIA